ncbi:hypothetical protein [Vibrio vulnificus]|uniref:hypothetical protein n=1 Tax=Vibrio vulnificus TaxID=672 RepID=UPI003ED8D393
MNDEKYRNYLVDLGSIAKEYAQEAIEEYEEAKGSTEEGFKAGYMMGFHRIITLMQQQAESFDIPLSELGLSDIDDSEFLK